MVALKEITGSCVAGLSSARPDRLAAGARGASTAGRSEWTMGLAQRDSEAAQGAIEGTASLKDIDLPARRRRRSLSSRSLSGSTVPQRLLGLASRWEMTGAFAHGITVLLRQRGVSQKQGPTLSAARRCHQLHQLRKPQGGTSPAWCSTEALEAAPMLRSRNRNESEAFVSWGDCGGRGVSRQGACRSWTTTGPGRTKLERGGLLRMTPSVSVLRREALSVL